MAGITQKKQLHFHCGPFNGNAKEKKDDTFLKKNAEEKKILLP